jgi:hypothetical protein
MVRRAALLGIVLLGLVGCGEGGELKGTVVPARTVTPTPTPTLVPTQTPTAAPTQRPTAIPTHITAQPRVLAPAPTLTSVPSPTSALSSSHIGLSHEGGTLGQVWQLADIRVGLHPDRIRVVWEMEEVRQSAPHFTMVEVDNAQTLFPSAPEGQTTYDPSWGQARIDVLISDLYAMGYPLQEQLPLMAPENPVVTKVGRYPTYDDALLGFSLGLKRPAAYEVITLTDPVRIVVDVLY